MFLEGHVPSIPLYKEVPFYRLEQIDQYKQSVKKKKKLPFLITIVILAKYNIVLILRRKEQ